MYRQVLAGIYRRVTVVFDTVLGLPVHALVVHGVVVLLPLMAIITAVVACVPRWPFGRTLGRAAARVQNI